MMSFSHGGQVSSSSNRSCTNSDDGNDIFEVTLSVSGDSVAVHSVKHVEGVTDLEDPDQSLLARPIEKVPSISSSIVRSASAKMKQISDQLKRLGSSYNMYTPVYRLDSANSETVYALEGLRFISKTEGSPAGWTAVKKRFANLTALTDGKLHRSQFHECIGMKEDSKMFALELFDALCRRTNIRKDSVTENELRVFWEEISNENFDSRLQTFFAMHPFSITSAPSEDYLSVHIQTSGDWTRQLRNVLSKVCHPPVGDTSGHRRVDLMDGIAGAYNPTIPVPEVLIDGPYGAPAQDYMKYEVVLLVGSGIGATPMISIIKDIANKMKAGNTEALYDSIGLETTDKNKTKRFKTQKAYFYWITREQNSFDSFKGVMNEVVEMDTQNVIEIHNHCTSVYERGDARSAMIVMLQSLNHAVTGVDVVAGTHVKSHFGRPNWSEVYKTIAVKHRGSRVGVFYCGVPALVDELRQLASDFTREGTTTFDFHKENF